MLQRLQDIKVTIYDNSWINSPFHLLYQNKEKKRIALENIKFVEFVDDEQPNEPAGFMFQVSLSP